MLKRLFLLFAILILAAPQPVSAQDTGAIYIVQPGDTLSSIAERFGVTVDDLMAANGIVNPNLLAVGQRLIIPGLEGISGVLDTQVIGFGDSLRSLLRRTQMPLPLLRRLNRLVSPAELYVGASLIIPVQDEGGLNAHTAPRPGESLLEASVRQGADPWTMATLNGLAGTWDVVPGDSLYSPTGSSDPSLGGMPSAFLSAEVKTLPIKQGGTAEIVVQAAQGATLSGILVDHPLHFFPLGDGRQVALQGVHAMLEPGVYPLRLDATLTDGSSQSYEQMILIVSGNYGSEKLVVDPATIDPAATEPENQQILSIVTPATPQRYWTEPFRLPVPEDARGCIKGWFGMRRDYNAGSYYGFHSGVDYGICSETKPFDIYAPAPGVVVFVGRLTVRGNATVIDHGWGVYSGMWHQEETYVNIGDVVGTGQLIGKIGGTGRVTGPHLHWEIWVNGIQVDPLDWLDAAIP
ncbi:MAG: LysM peptidoglycan-binding domain-containing protein [Chloroflexota bacterium]